MTMTVHIYKLRQLKWTWFGVNLPSGCWDPVSARFQECLLRPWARPCSPNGQMTMTVHIYKLRRFKWTWFGVTLPNGCWDPVSARFQECLLRPWTRPCGPNGQMTIIVPIYKPRRFKLTWFGVNLPSGCWILASARSQETLLCPWARPCSPNGQMTMTVHIYSPRQFQRTLFEVNRPSGCGVTVSASSGTDGRTDGRKDGRRLFYSPPCFPSERRGTTITSIGGDLSRGQAQSRLNVEFDIEGQGQ